MATLYLMSGLGFSGKSTLARTIAERKNAVLVSQDELYFERENEWDDERDEDEQWRELQDMCKERIKENLSHGNAVVYDDTNIRRSERDELRAVAAELGADVKLIYLDTPMELRTERQSENKESGERHDVEQKYLEQGAQELEVPADDENPYIFKPETDLETFLANL